MNTGSATRVIGRIITGEGRAPKISSVDADSYGKSVKRVDREYGMTNEKHEVLKPFTFRITFDAYTLDDALEFLHEAGLDVTDAGKVKWLD